MATRTSKGGSLWRPSGRGRQSIRAKTPAQRSALKCRRKFLRFFPGGFADETYIEWERGYKWEAHERWMSVLAPDAFRALLRERRFADIASHAVAIESRTNLLFSFEKMALRDAVKPPRGAQAFAEGLYEFLHGRAGEEPRFDQWCETVAAREYEFDFRYTSRPDWTTYASLLDFAARVLRDQRDLGPRDMIDAQSFIWVQGSDEYDE